MTLTEESNPLGSPEGTPSEPARQSVSRGFPDFPAMPQNKKKAIIEPKVLSKSPKYGDLPKCCFGSINGFYPGTQRVTLIKILIL